MEKYKRILILNSNISLQIELNPGMFRRILFNFFDTTKIFVVSTLRPKTILFETTSQLMMEIFLTPVSDKVRNPYVVRYNYTVRTKFLMADASKHYQY